MEFAEALSQGLAAGYWPAGNIERVDGLQDGLRLRCNQVSGDPTNMKRPLEILADALRRAGVQIDSSGTKSAGDVAVDECLIEVGSRRRDREAMPVKMTIRKIEPPSK